jgi:hypothetical protein
MPLKNDSNDVRFMDYVQQHERTWGTETYSGRPDLVDILSAPVVVFWKSDEKAANPPKRTTNNGRYTISLHLDLHEIEEHLIKLIMRGNLESPKQRIIAIFKDQKRVRVKGVKIEFSQPD